MMEPRLVWDTWRRILTNDALVGAVLEPPADFASLALPPEETAIVADYASTRAATDQTIFMYRAGLARNALCALTLVPMSDRLLHTSGLDPEEVANDFARSIGYRDDGPYLWRQAADFVAYLAALPRLARGAKRDAFAIDAATIALYRRLGEHSPAMWPDDVVAQRTRRAGRDARYVASRAAAIVSTRWDVAPWIENPFDFDVAAPLARVKSHWLVYLPNRDAAIAYAASTGDVARAFARLAAPKSASDLAAELRVSVAEAREAIDSLATLGVVMRA